MSLLFVSAECALSLTRPELQSAVDSLSTMLHRVRNEGLGVEALEVSPVTLYTVYIFALLDLIF